MTSPANINSNACAQRAESSKKPAAKEPAQPFLFVYHFNVSYVLDSGMLATSDGTFETKCAVVGDEIYKWTKGVIAAAMKCSPASLRVNSFSLLHVVQRPAGSGSTGPLQVVL